MRFLLKLVTLPLILITGLLYMVCQFLVTAAGTVLGIVSGLVFLASLVLFFTAGVWSGLAFLLIAFLLSPYGLPMAAAWLTGKIGGLNSYLRELVG